MQVRTAVVVPGHAARGGCISGVCLGLVREAERLAAARAVDAVIFTGWARGDGPSEAQQMRDAWQGPDVELVVEPTASRTAENASRTLPLLVERSIRRAIVVCAPLHQYRVRFFFSRLYRLRGIETEFHVARALPGPRALLWELAAVAVCRRQLRAARMELTRE